MKVCLKCYDPKPLDKFYTTKKGYTNNTCNDCKTEYHQTYRENNRAAIRERDAKRRELIKSLPKNRTERKPYDRSKCLRKSCTEKPGDYYGLEGYCRSHAFDKAHGVT